MDNQVSPNSSISGEDSLGLVSQLRSRNEDDLYINSKMNYESEGSADSTDEIEFRCNTSRDRYETSKDKFNRSFSRLDFQNNIQLD